MQSTFLNTYFYISGSVFTIHPGSYSFKLYVFTYYENLIRLTICFLSVLDSLCVAWQISLGLIDLRRQPCLTFIVNVIDKH